MSTRIQAQQQAFDLYMNQNKTQREIAQIIGVTERTIYNWIHRHSWDKLRQAALQAPAVLVENSYSELVELQNSIARREPGMRYPTKDESLIMLRLATIIEKNRRVTAKGATMQVLQTFRSYVRNLNPDLNRTIGVYTSKFLHDDPVNGYYPYEMEFGAEKIAPVSPFYDESAEDDLAEIPSSVPETIEVSHAEIHPDNPSQQADNQLLAPISDTCLQPEKTGNSDENTPPEDDADWEPFPWRLTQESPDQSPPSPLTNLDDPHRFAA